MRSINIQKPQCSVWKNKRYHRFRHNNGKILCTYFLDDFLDIRDLLSNILCSDIYTPLLKPAVEHTATVYPEAIKILAVLSAVIPDTAISIFQQVSNS